MKLDAQIREPAICPACGSSAGARDILRVLIAFGEDRCVTTTFACRSCGQRFQTESLGTAEAVGTPVEPEDEAEVTDLGETIGTVAMLAEFRRLEGQ